MVEGAAGKKQCVAWWGTHGAASSKPVFFLCLGIPTRLAAFWVLPLRTKLNQLIIMVNHTQNLTPASHH